MKKDLFPHTEHNFKLSNNNHPRRALLSNQLPSLRYTFLFYADIMANFTLLHLAGNDNYQNDLYGMVHAEGSDYSGYQGLETILQRSCPKVMKAKYIIPS